MRLVIFLYVLWVFTAVQSEDDMSWHKNFTQSVRVELPVELVNDLNIPGEEVFIVSL